MSLKFTIVLDPEVEEELEYLATRASNKTVLKAIVKTLRLMKENLKHPSLNTHKYSVMKGPDGEEIFESYAQNNTPGAYRIFWYYGPEKSVITVLVITAHP